MAAGNEILQVWGVLQNIGVDTTDWVDMIDSYAFLKLLDSEFRLLDLSLEHEPEYYFVSFQNAYKLAHNYHIQPSFLYDLLFNRYIQGACRLLHAILFLGHSPLAREVRDFANLFLTGCILDKRTFFSHMAKTKVPSDYAFSAIACLLRIDRITGIRFASDDAMNCLYEKETIKHLWEDIYCLPRELFVPCYKAMFVHTAISLPVQNKRNMQDAISAYKEQNVPLARLLGDYYVWTGSKQELEAAYNPWKTANKKVGLEVEAGWTYSETLFEYAAQKIKNEKPTTVIRSLFFDGKKNDSALELSVLYPLFLDCCTSRNNVVVAFPSPDFLLRLSQEIPVWGQTITFICNDSVVAALYSREFQEVPYFRFLSVEEVNGLQNVEALLYIARYDEKPSNVMAQMMNACIEGARIMLLTPQKFVDDYGQTMDRFLQETACFADEYMLVPFTLPNSLPKKKMIGFLHKGKPTELPEQPSMREIFYDKKRQLYQISTEAYRIPDNPLACGETLLSTLALLKKRAATEEVSRRDPARQYDFSNEIKVAYVLKINHGVLSAKAYYAEITDKETQKGKRLTPFIEKGLRAKSGKEEDVLKGLEKIPFDERFEHVILDEVAKHYGHAMNTVSLKTMWFCLRSKLEYDRNAEYDDAVAQKLFCGECQDLSGIFPDEAEEKEYTDAMEALLCSEDGLRKTDAWKQLSLIISAAIDWKWMRVNPLEKQLTDMELLAQKKEKEIRNALVKKSLTLDEERSILEYLRQPVEMPSGKRLPRYVVSGLALAVAIKMFTGMDTREICALSWKDFAKIPYLKCYQFVIVRFAAEKGTIIDCPEDNLWKKFRLIPCPWQLSKMILENRAFRAKASGTSIEKMGNEPLILDERKMGGAVEFCSTRRVARACREAIEAANIPEQLLHIPTADGMEEVDINKFYGDLLIANFRYRANQTCKLTRGELCYILGINPPDTFSEHYCDYTNDLVQLTISKKMERWTFCHFYEQGAKDASSATEKMSVNGKDTITPVGGTPASADIHVNMSDVEELEIRIESDFGFYGDVTVY